MTSPSDLTSMSVSADSSNTADTPFSSESLNEKTSLPSLEDKPIAHQAKSHGLLLFIVLGAVAGCWLLGFSLFQVSPGSSWKELLALLGAFAAAALALLVWTGTHSLDLWTLVMRWGWYTLPLVGATGLLFVMMQERTDGMESVE